MYHIPMTPSGRLISIALQGDKSAREYAEIAEMAEGLGFDGVSVYADLGFQPAIAPLVIIAQQTRRVRVGPAALNPSLIHPVEIAGQIAMLDAISDGRAYLGLARGAWLDALGIDERRPVRRLREAVEVITRVLAGDAEGYEGEIFRLPPQRLRRYDVPRAAVPLTIGTWGRQAGAFAGEVASEIKIGGSANPAMVPSMRGFLRVGEERAGRPIGGVGVALGAVTICDEDGDAARALARREVARYLPVVAPLDPTVHVAPETLRRMARLVDAGDVGAAADLVPDDLLDRFAFSGTPGQIVRQAEAIFAAGASRIEFGTPHGVTALQGIRLLGEQVLPALRRTPGAT
ncbi:MAG: LLM class flavin-dependent oxidoreductase [Thermomicrobiales bacterium]